MFVGCSDFSMIFGMSEGGSVLVSISLVALTWKQVVGLGTAASLGRSAKYASGAAVGCRLSFRPHETLV